MQRVVEWRGRWSGEGDGIERARLKQEVSRRFIVGCYVTVSVTCFPFS